MISPTNVTYKVKKVIIPSLKFLNLNFGCVSIVNKEIKSVKLTKNCSYFRKVISIKTELSPLIAGNAPITYSILSTIFWNSHIQTCFFTFRELNRNLYSYKVREFLV